MDPAHLARLEAYLAIAEQTLNAAQNLEPATPAPPLDRPPGPKLAVSVVIPVYNERDTVVEIVRRVQAVGIHQEIVLVDDFSTDGTRELLLELGREPDIRVVMHGYNRGKGAASAPDSSIAAATWWSSRTPTWSTTPTTCRR